jgi:hypothetical protein
MVIRNFLFALLVVAPVFICAENEFPTNSAPLGEFVDEGYILIIPNALIRAGHRNAQNWRKKVEKALGKSLEDDEFLVETWIFSKPLPQGMPENEADWQALGKSANWSRHSHPGLEDYFPEYLPLSLIQGNEGEAFELVLEGGKKVRLIRGQLQGRYQDRGSFETLLTALKKNALESEFREPLYQAADCACNARNFLKEQMKNIERAKEKGEAFSPELEQLVQRDLEAAERLCTHIHKDHHSLRREVEKNFNLKSASK